MAKRRRPWKKVQPSAELLAWVEDQVMATMRAGDGKAFWSHIQGAFNKPSLALPAEWVLLSDYGKMKVFNSVLDRLSERRVIYREKNYRPFVMVNPLDLIVEAISRDDTDTQN